MRRYSDEEEERIRAQALVREWTRSGLLDRSQGVRLDAELRVDVRRTNVFLRAGLAFFAALIISASVLFVIVGLDLEKAMPVAMVAALAAAGCLALAEWLIGQFRLYRFGVEEALAVASVLLLAASGTALTSTLPLTEAGDAPLAVGFLIAAAGGLGLYLRFGFVYAAIGGTVCAAAIPFQLRLSETTRHVVAAAMFAAVFLIVRPRRLRYQDDYPGGDYGLMQAAAWVGLYFMLNLQLTGGRTTRFFFGYNYETASTWMVFYWATYVATWILPVVGLGLGIRAKDRALIDVSLAIALISLLTNKAYLGWPRHAWDPILLGVFLMAVALVLRRWLSQGPDGQRGGFTPERLLSKENEKLTLLGTASVKFQPDVPAIRPEPVKSEFDGGRSGGGGATGSY